MENSKTEVKGILVKGLTVLAALAARKVLEKTWQATTKQTPPKNPDDFGVTWKDAIIWTVSTGVILGLTKLVVRRNASIGADKLLS